MRLKTLGLLLMVVGFSVLAMVGLAAVTLLPTLAYLQTQPLNAASAKFIFRALEWVLFAAVPILAVLVIVGGMAAAGVIGKKKPDRPV